MGEYLRISFWGELPDVLNGSQVGPQPCREKFAEGSAKGSNTAQFMKGAKRSFLNRTNRPPAAAGPQRVRGGKTVAGRIAS